MANIGNSTASVQKALSQATLAGAALEVQFINTKREKETFKAGGASRKKSHLKTVPLPKARILLRLKTAANVDVMVNDGQPLQVVIQQLNIAVLYTRWINAEETRILSTQQAAQTVAQGQALSRAGSSSPPMGVVHRLECQLDGECLAEGKILARASRALMVQSAGETDSDLAWTQLAHKLGVYNIIEFQTL